MNIPHDPDGEEFRSEWEAQERAREAERSGVNPAGAYGDVAKYRLIARALRTPRIGPLPEDFAVSVAARIGASTVAIEDLLERWLLRVLFLLLAAGGAVAVLSGGWLTSAYSQLDTLEYLGVGTGWMLVAVACLALSLAMEHLWGDGEIQKNSGGQRA